MGVCSDSPWAGKNITPVVVAMLFSGHFGSVPEGSNTVSAALESWQSVWGVVGGSKPHPDSMQLVRLTSLSQCSANNAGFRFR